MNNKGLGVIEILIIIVVLVGLLLIFKEQVVDIINIIKI